MVQPVKLLLIALMILASAKGSIYNSKNKDYTSKTLGSLGKIFDSLQIEESNYKTLE